MISLIDTCLVVNDCLSLAIWEIKLTVSSDESQRSNAMTESFRAKSFAIEATSGLSGCCVPGRLENELTREFAITEQLVMSVAPEVNVKLIGNGTYIKSLSFNFKSFTIQRLQNTASWFPGTAARLLPLHRPNRFLENCYQICLLLCRAFHECESVDLVLQFLPIRCRHELFRVLHSQVCFRSCTQKKFLLNDAHRWITRIQTVTNDSGWLRLR